MSAYDGRVGFTCFICGTNNGFYGVCWDEHCREIAVCCSCFYANEPGIYEAKPDREDNRWHKSADCERCDQLGWQKGKP